MKQLPLWLATLCVLITTGAQAQEFKAGWTDSYVALATDGCVRSVMSEAQDLMRNQNVTTRGQPMLHMMNNVRKSCSCISHEIASNVTLEQMSQAPEYYSQQVIQAAFASGDCPVPFPAATFY